jgi:hypothetical protein
MDLETADSRPIKNVTEEQLRQAFCLDAGFGEFIILSQAKEVYMQAAGEGDGPYRLEYRDGEESRHFCAGDHFKKDGVLRGMVSYLSGDERWRSEFKCERF